MVRKHQKQSAARRYLLKQLSDAEQQNFELQLLSDDALSEELEIVEDELIDEYLANELSRDERVTFENIFLAHPERKRKLEAGQALNRYFDTLPPPPTPAPSRFEFLHNWIGQSVSGPWRLSNSPRSGTAWPISSPIVATAALLVVALAGFIIWRAVLYQSDLEKGLLALNEAYSQERPVEARISNLDHAPFLATRSNEPPRVDTLKRDRAERFLSDAFTEHADAESYHALGKLYLLKREIDKAIDYLEQARKADPDDAQIYADLGAAYLEKAKPELNITQPDRSGPGDGKGLEDLGRSLEYLKQALELNPNLREALFNRALVHEYQGLHHHAAADWRAYLQVDPNSPWAAEAQQKLKLLEDKKSLALPSAGDPVEAFLRAYRSRDDEAVWEIYKRSHGSAVNRVTKGLVDDLLADNAKRRPAENLEALNYLGQLELRKVQDAYTSDLARVYASATPQTKALLVQARQEVAKGYDLFSQSRIGAAIELFVSARSTFEKVGNVPELLAAEAAIAHAAAIQPDIAIGQKAVAAIIPVCESNDYKWLLAQTLTRRAQIQSNLNNYSEAIGDGHRALQLFQELNDASNAVGTLTQLASLHVFLNDTETSFSYLRRALAIAEREVAAPTDMWGIHIAISFDLSAVQLYRAALDYQNEALQLALASRIPLLISRSYQNIGLTYGSLRQFDLALQNVRRAYEQGKPLATERNGQSMMANASLKLGDLYRASGEPGSALEAYEESSRLYEGLNFAHYNYAAHKGKFLSYLAQNNDAQAERELQIVLGLFETYREKIHEERQKTFFFDREQNIYDLAIDFTYSRLADQQRAFDYSEICRARNLRELIHHGAEVTQTDSGFDLRASKDVKSQEVLPLTGAEIQQKMPEQVQIVQYAVLEKKLLIWHVTRSGIFSKSVEVESAKLSDGVKTTLKQILQRDENGTAASLKNLYDLLIEPIKEKLDSNKVLCFVPDKDLHFLPFGALMSGRSGRYLVQDYRLITSPSATILIDSTNQARDRSSVNEERLLAVGDPAFERAVNPNFSNLPAARREVEAIASSYVSPRMLVAGEATRNSIMNEITRADVAHFAAHYEVDPRSMLSSKLLLASEPGERAHAQPSGLSSGDIYRMNLDRTRLVVLAACKTGVEQQFGGEGPVGFARSFLVAGVPVVVASLWPVASDATSELMIAFHRFRRVKHLSTTEALMHAQQEMMAHAKYRHPFYWAGFTAIGGHSDF